MTASSDGSDAAAGGIEDLAARVRTALADGEHLDEVRAAAAGPFVGTAADGQITAEVGADGRVRTLVIGDELYRGSLTEVAVAARSAVNAALDARAGGGGFAPVVDLVAQIQSQARRDLGAVSQAMAEAAQRIRSAQQGGA